MSTIAPKGTDQHDGSSNLARDMRCITVRVAWEKRTGAKWCNKRGVDVVDAAPQLFHIVRLVRVLAVGAET